LLNIFRPQGAPYLPDVAAKFIARYQFAKPPALDDLQKDTVIFQIGKFQDVQIAEFGVYGDGLIANGKCDTQFLEAFLEDVLSWAQAESGMAQILTHRNEISFESNIIVQSESDIAALIAPNAVQLVTNNLQDKLGVSFQPCGLVFDCDASAIKIRRKPWRFYIERRVGISYSENIFFCQAPLRTADHLDLLQSLEKMALGL
jgi:hypothetical protein